MKTLKFNFATVLMVLFLASCEQETLTNELETLTNEQEGTEILSQEEASENSCNLQFARDLGYRIVLTNDKGQVRSFTEPILEVLVEDGIFFGAILDLNFLDIGSSPFFRSGIRSFRLVSNRPVSKELEFRALAQREDLSSVPIAEDRIVKEGDRINLNFVVPPQARRSVTFLSIAANVNQSICFNLITR